MNRVAVFFLILLASLLVACGSTRPAKVIDGAWNANLQNPDDTSAYTFSTTLNQSTGSAVTVISFLFTASAPCFSSSTGQTATFSATGHAGGYQTGPFSMNISTALGGPVENVLTLSGTRKSDGTITGTWSLSGLPGCSGSGAYSMKALPML
jgi:hypothetical protein